MASPVVLSVNVGQERPQGPKGRPTGIDKHPVDVLEVRAPGPKRGGLGSGVVGDFVGDRRHHGGDGQAVYAVAREELDWWAAELGRDLPSGFFGENLTTAAFDVDGACLGDVCRIGAALLEVTGPRVPCSTFAAQMGVPQWVRRFTERGRTGAYFAVREPGSIRAGDAIEVIERATHGITVPMAFRAWMGDAGLRDRILATGAGRDDLRAELAARAPRSSPDVPQRVG
ncbi:MAG: MOSC domain-containing protein [Dermatophilaceae bacterium]